MKTAIIILSSFLAGTLLSGLISQILDQEAQFFAIMVVVAFDTILGIIRAFYKKEFETKKAFKGIGMLVAYWALLAVVLAVEAAYPFANFLSEAILLPIITFQIISILKNMHILGLISGTVLDKIFKNIDAYKSAPKVPGITPTDLPISNVDEL